MTGTVVCADPQADEREETAAALSAAGFEVETYGSVDGAREALDRAGDCLVTEYEFPDGTGLDLLRYARETDPDVAVVLYSGVDPAAADTSSVAGDVVEYVPKDEELGLELLVDLVEGSVGGRAQTAYPVPDDEPDRLATLSEYADVVEGASESIERLADLACATLDVPMAGVGIVDENEEWFLSCIGASFDTLAREDTICTYAMLDEEVTVIEDVREDPRFDGNEYLDAVRFYASANLTTPDGSVIGTFCVYDTEPRGLDEDDRERLQAFADEAMEQLELRRLAAADGEVNADD